MAECPNDKDMLEMATEDLGKALEEEKRLQNLLLKSLLPRDDADERDSILEVRAGNNCMFKWHMNTGFCHCSLLNIFPAFLIRNWWGGGFFVCDGCVQNVSQYNMASWSVHESRVLFRSCLSENSLLGWLQQV